jgi:transposase InsO family protein
VTRKVTTSQDGVALARCFADNRSKFISKLMGKWAYERGIELDFRGLGKPTNNAMVEA